MKQREIKFRVWNNVDYMSKPFTLNDVVHGRIGFTADATVMQFTGIQDSRGKDIYEGDVVATAGLYDPETGQTETSLCVVRYDGPSLMYVDLDNDDANSVESIIGVCSQDEDAEVIGNVFENPELLPTNTQDK